MRKQETKKVEKKEFNLQEAFVLWIKSGKSGKYLTGHDLNNNKLISFINTKKKNDKEPDYRVYDLDKEGKINKEVCGLWLRKDKNDKTYLSGLTNEKENIVAFLGEETKEARPYIRAYFRED